MAMTELETRTNLIDPKLKLAGYIINHTHGVIEAGKVCVETEVQGMPITETSPTGRGFVDYVIFNVDGKPLALIEAKKSVLNEDRGRTQANLYADCLERKYGVRPIVYYTNGYTITVEDGVYPARKVFGFHKMDELQHLIQRRTFKFLDKKVNPKICDRYYQKDAIDKVIEHLDSHHSRSLIVLATGTGKTRVSCALSDILLKNNLCKRILFIADRKNLVKQAKEECYDKLLDGVSTSLIVEGQREDETNQARIVFSTYQSMLSIIKDVTNIPYGIGHFDYIICDEVQRSIFNKYAEIFSYFDAFLIGLTATPRNDVHKSTYKVFNLDNDCPNYEYDVIRGVQDGYLNYFKALDRTPDTIKNGKRYDDLTEDEKEEYDDLFTDEDGERIDKIEGDNFKTFITNIDTIKKVLKQVMDEGLYVNNGDTLGKTIIFAKDHNHAKEIEHQFDLMFPELAVPKQNGVKFCVTIDNQERFNEILQREFKAKNDIRIVVSVDMMDTGVDIPDVVNLVFFKTVLSKIKFWQMIGRGTRLAKGINVISPSRDYFEGNSSDSTRKLYNDKQGFLIFDVCNVFNFFNMHPEGKRDNSDNVLSISQMLFVDKCILLSAMQRNYSKLPEDDRVLYSELKKELVNTIKGFNRNFLGVQAKLQLVEKYSLDSTWNSFGASELKEVQENLAILVRSDEPGLLCEKAFDRICYMFAHLRFDSQDDFKKVAKRLFLLISKGLLESKLHIDEVRSHENILRTVITDDFMNNASIKNIDDARKEIRPLIKYIEKHIATIIIDINDEISSSGEINFGGPISGDPVKISTNDFRTIKEKIVDFVNTNTFNPFVLAIRNFEDVRPFLNEFKEKIISLASIDEYNNTFESDKDLITFVRMTVGIAQSSIEKFLDEIKEAKGYIGDQLDYIEMLLNFISENGTFERHEILREELYFSDYFNSIEIKELLDIIMERIPEVL